MDETSGTGDLRPGPGWLDDPFRRTGQRWWDGEQWTARTRAVHGHRQDQDRRGASRSLGARQPAPAERRTPATGPSTRGGAQLRSVGAVIAGVFLVFAVVGLIAPSAEESGALAEGYPRAAYWSCADLLAQRLGPAVELDFPGDSTATITHDGQVWEVTGPVDVIGDQGSVARDWRCTVTFDDDGIWRGSAALVG